MELYNRHIIYHRFFEGDQFRPYISVPSLSEAVAVFDDTHGKEQIKREMKIIDLEHIDMGDMLVHPDTQDLIAKIRAKQRA